ncbi:hypothetical protein [Goekera deserti]|nr:hypothetical protein [Goekera deserti]
MRELDLRGSDPAAAPPRSTVTAVLEDAEHVLVRGPVPALAAALAALWKAGRLPAVSLGWDPADDPASRGLARDLGIGAADGERELGLVRDDHGGVLLQHGRLAATADPAPSRFRRPARFGAQAHHDDARVADGEVSRLEVRPDRSTPDTLSVAVVTVPLRPARRSTGRVLQVACDPARVWRDGVLLDRPVSRWTWYADDRVRWRLRP